MTTTIVTTKIKAPIETVFDIARNIDIHQLSAAKSNEKAIDGKTTGLIEFDETVTWSGKHFGLQLLHKSRITKFHFPTYFVDEMEEGHFKSFKHEHFFQTESDYTIMIDRLEYETPFRILGVIFDRIVLKKYLTNFIKTRNKILKNIAENPQ
ncbi:SRPBCC family protein [Flavobacterium azooxidireducens]|uniref:SRPBCC family protein n=1 Tax=Flavobacterium azooxidireducens TaxID=1871076 RepID=A0ABY4KEH9_9FLAO|nr:SRPBCC family protein [Flavobacterium azooxidireducens]UPQ77902.1 SRPBCC family protein [Flavobacterium azooxidireducens]